MKYENNLSVLANAVLEKLETLPMLFENDTAGTIFDLISQILNKKDNLKKIGELDNLLQSLDMDNIDTTSLLIDLGNLQ